MLVTIGNDAFTAFLADADQETLSLRRVARRLRWVAVLPAALLGLVSATDGLDTVTPATALNATLLGCLVLWVAAYYLGRLWVARGLDFIALRFLDLHPRFADSYTGALESLISSATGSGVETELIARLPGPGEAPPADQAKEAG